MVKFVIEESDECIVTHSGLSIVGQLLSNTHLEERLNSSLISPVSDPFITNSEVIISYIGLLCQGKTAYEDIEEFREDPFFSLALNLDNVPSCSTLRQRMNEAGTQWNTIIDEEMVLLLAKIQPVLTPCLDDLIPLDIDVSPFDNSKTKKEGVSRTYKGFDGYAPIFAYLGQEGYCVNTELRTGKTHCQNGTVSFLAESIRRAKSITDAPLLVRLDSGNDSKDNINVCLTPETSADFIIKRNLRKESPESWLSLAKKEGEVTKEREGKKVYRGSTDRIVEGAEEPVRIVYEITERTIKADGQILLMPDIEVDTYWTSLENPEEVIFDLYHDHGTSEQFHSEIKTDIGLERFPSGKFATNSLILHLAIMAYNLLRLIGQESIKEDDEPVRKKVGRRRLRTVIQNLITIASKMVHHARRFSLKFGSHCPWINTFKRIYTAFVFT